MSAWLSPVEVQSVFMSRSFSSCDYVSEFANTTANTTEVSTTISPLSSLPSVNNGCLYESGSLLPMFMKLIGGDSNKIKAFECVGTFSEASAAVELSLYQYQRLDLAIPPILRSLCEYLGIEIMKSTSQNDHTFDVCMEELVKNICRKWNIDEITIS